MTPERWGEIDRLFHAALEREPSERPDFIARECADDLTLIREVELLLASYGEAGDFIEEPASDLAAALLEEERTGLLPGQRVGAYRVLSRLGAGGMGEVHLAVHERTGRKVALKLLPGHLAGDEARVRRFQQEARAVLRLNHPNIVTVYDIEQAGTDSVIASEYIEGETLRERLVRGPLLPAEALDVAAQIAAALSAAHAGGVVHRDIKPENVMLRPDGFVKVLDFGLAKLNDQMAPFDTQAPPGSAVKTNPGMVMGTVGYMSPEQALGREVDARTDIWSLGVLLYEMLTGRPPFEGETPSHVTVAILDGEPPPLTDYADVPEGLGRVVAKALSKDPAGRYRRADEVARELKKLQQELGVESRQGRPRRPDATGVRAVTGAAGVTTAHRTSSAEYLINGFRRRPGGTIFASAAALALVASLLWNYSNRATGGGGEAIDSVAVLPIVNAGGDPDAEYLADGISDSVIGSLSTLPGLRVISLGTALRYKGRQIDPQAVGRELDVRAVLVGRVARRGDALVVSAELVDVKDHRRLWGGQYNRKPSDILAVQDEIAREIAERLRPRLGGAEKQRLARRRTESADAYHAYARGRFLLEKRTGPTTEKSVEYFEQAIGLDPGYALAHAALAHAYLSLAKLGARVPTEEALPRAKAAAAKALELDDTLAEAHTALGYVRTLEWDWPGAGRAYARAGDLAPNYERDDPEGTHADYLRAMKRFDEAVAESERSLKLDPASVIRNRNVAQNLYFARRYDEAIEQSRKALELDPNMPTAYRWLAKSFEQKRLYGEAVEAYLRTAEFTALGPEAGVALRGAYAAGGWEGFWLKSAELRKERAKQGNVNPYVLAETFARLGEKDQAFALLEKAYGQRRPAIILLNSDPIWDFLRTDPRYADLVQRMGLEP